MVRIKEHFNFFLIFNTDALKCLEGQRWICGLSTVENAYWIKGSYELNMGFTIAHKETIRPNVFVAD